MSRGRATSRVGRFGNLPSDAPDLSATIVSLYEQYERQRDQNILDAWQNGGEFEGKPVTDQRLLAWYRMRMGEVSRKDPMYDYWSDAYHQTRFAIAEQKANLHYTQGKMDESDMASFYKEWAGKLPRASAAWRDLMTSAARFAKAAKAGRASSGAAARAEALNARINAIQQNQVQPAYDLLYALAQAGQGQFGGTSSYGFANQSVYEFSTNLDSAATMDEQLAAIQQNPALEKRMRNAIRYYVPGFDGNLTVPLLIQAINKAKAGIRAQARVYRAYGEKDAARDRLAEGRKFDANLATLRSIDDDIADRYIELRNNFDEDMAAANGAIGRQMVREQHAAAMETLAIQFERNGSISQAGALRARAAALRGDEAASAVRSLDEAFMGGTPGDTSGKAISEGTENGRLAQSALRDRTQLEALSKGGVLITVDGEEQIVPAAAASSALGVQGGSRLIARDLQYGGGVFRFAGGDVEIKPGLIAEAAVEQPVAVSVPSPGDPVDLVSNDLIGGTGLPTQGGRTQIVGTRTDWGNGEIMWGSPLGPGGRYLYSDIPPFNGNGVRASGMKDGVWRVEYDIVSLISRDTNDGGLSDILSDIIDPKTGQPVLDSNGVVRRQFDPSRLAGGSPLINPSFDPVPDPAADTTGTRVDAYTALADKRDPRVPEEMWRRMIVDVQRGMDPDSREFKDKWATELEAVVEGPSKLPALSIRDAAVQNLREARDRGVIPVFGGRPDAVTGPTAPDGLDQATWNRMLTDAKAGMSGSDLIAKYSADVERLNPQNKAAAMGLVSRFASQAIEQKDTAVIVPETGPTSAPAVKARSNDDWNRVFYATLATHPTEVSWMLPSLYKAARTPESRQRWSASVDPVEFVNKAIERDPSLKNDPAALAILAEQVDVLTGAGRSGLSEQAFTRERLMAMPGVDPGVALLVTSRTQVTPRQSVADVFGVGNTGSMLPDRVSGPVPDTTPKGFLPDGAFQNGGFKVPGGVQVDPPTPETATQVTGLNSSGAPVIMPTGESNSSAVVANALSLRRANVVRPTGVRPADRPKAPKPPKIKPPKIVLPEPPAPVPIGSGGQQTRRGPGGVIYS